MYCPVLCSIVFYMFSKQGRKIRKERLKFANNECELAIFGRANCKNYRLECHHKDSESYKKDENGTICINDVIIVCSYCHDFITNQQRSDRFKTQKLECELIINQGNEVRYDLGKTKISATIGMPFNDAKCSSSRSDKQIYKRNEEDFWKKEENRC